MAKHPTTAEFIARDIIAYCFENEMLSHQGMSGLRQRIESALLGGDDLHALALKRVEKIFQAEPNTPEGDELEAWVKAIERYESAIMPNNPHAPQKQKLNG